MNFQKERNLFEKKKKIYESYKLIFLGLQNKDVYNPSIPFKWGDKEYLYGRIEHRDEWARSLVGLFKRTNQDEWSLVSNSKLYQLEDPFITIINEELILGGVFVEHKQNKIDKYYTCFFRGKDPNSLNYFTSGPDNMKDIRLVELQDNKIGVFSRPKNNEIKKIYNSESIIGFTKINNLNELNKRVIEEAKCIPNLFQNGEWGGVNQAYQLENGLIGVIGHKCYKCHDQNNQPLSSYTNIAFIFDPIKHEILDLKIIGTRNCYPKGPTKKPYLSDCAFTSGIVLNDNNKVNLYSGLSDCEVGRILIDNPFLKYGNVINKQKELTLKK